MCHMWGKDQCALMTLLGWDSKENMGKGMTGLLGFTHHQCLLVLVSWQIRQVQNPPAGEEPHEKSKPSWFSCGRQRWKTFSYYSKGSQRELLLGEVIADFSSIFSLACDEAGCTFKCGEHHLKFTHGKGCVEVSFSAKDQSQGGGMVMWNSCAICGAKSDSKAMSDGT